MEGSKLVRDGIPEHIRDKGEEPKFRVAEQQEFEQRLNDKLLEEVKELIAAEDPEAQQEELADLLQVIEAYIELHGFDAQKISEIKARKAKEKGEFKQRYILETNDPKEI